MNDKENEVSQETEMKEKVDKMNELFAHGAECVITDFEKILVES